MHFSMYYGTDCLVFASKFILSGPVQTYPFSLKTQKFFFRFLKTVFPHLEFLCPFCPSRCVRFRLKAQKLFPFLIISPSTHGVFDTSAKFREIYSTFCICVRVYRGQCFLVSRRNFVLNIAKISNFVDSLNNK